MTNLDLLLERNRAFATTGAHTGLSMMPNQPIFDPPSQAHAEPSG